MACVRRNILEAASNVQGPLAQVTWSEVVVGRYYGRMLIIASTDDFKLGRASVETAAHQTEKKTCICAGMGTLGLSLPGYAVTTPAIWFHFMLGWPDPDASSRSHIADYEKDTLRP
jgi:hypothetical protein